ncbi:hypothetical protein PLICRDRAFT_32316 [Plicaturopsis crispa FD-325 SS-3]|uniref:Uncharacterized protein n=1 Tax=Plicaturopsis crispa FD-325 SS-3 TaxID=944288 RepID=A0A0C9SRH8_PLICR|nr:hypothetical protein PLICRDRAFT_32316 [Plicaturopsis crispa FD-325 SS-3]
MSSSYDAAHLAGLIVENILYGIFVSMLSLVGYLLVAQKKIKERTWWPLIVTVGAIFLLSTARLIVDSKSLFIAFVKTESRSERDAFLLGSYTIPKGLIGCGVIWLGDFFVIYRCWIVWRRRIEVVLAPIILTAGSLACGFRFVSLLGNHSTVVNDPQTLSRWLTGTFVLSLCTNVIATACLAFKIWSVDRRSRRNLDIHAKSLTPILLVIIESGALNAAFIFAFTFTFAVESLASIPLSYALPHINGSTFLLVIIRVLVDTAREARYTTFDDSRPISFRRVNPREEIAVSMTSMSAAGSAEETTRKVAESGEL